MKQTTQKKMKATPELEDFRHKYTEEGSGKIGQRLLDNYFTNVEKLVRKADIPPGKKLQAIELGCGEGYSTQRLVRILPENVELQASEYVERQIPFAKKNNPGMTITQESVYQLSHKDKTFDMVFLLEVLEHLDYPDQALAEIARSMKQGGYLVIGVPREPIWRMLNMARGAYLKDFGNTPGHLNHWSKRSLVYFVEEYFGPVMAVENPLPWTLVLAKKSNSTV
jgi:2-polyprenyl-3-methyl-5-hydroxy-6-metoxy-1,4-benzoquinol methylase